MPTLGFGAQRKQHFFIHCINRACVCVIYWIVDFPQQVDFVPIGIPFKQKFDSAALYSKSHDFDILNESPTATSSTKSSARIPKATNVSHDIFAENYKLQILFSILRMVHSFVWWPVIGNHCRHSLGGRHASMHACMVTMLQTPYKFFVCLFLTKRQSVS